MHYYFKQSIAFCAIAIGSLAVNDVDADGWPIVRFQNGTVGVQNEGGEVHVRADVMKLNTNVLMLNDIDLIPPKCMAPGGDRLQHNGTHFVCFCTESWSGRTCEVPPSPPPPSPPSPRFLNEMLFEYKPENVVGTTVKDTSSSSLSIGDAYLSQSGCISVGSSGDVFQASCTTSESYENVIQTPEIDMRRDFTLETYVKFTDRTTEQFLFGQGTNTANAGLHIGVVSSSRGFVFGFYGNDIDSGWNPTLNTWYHLVFTYTHSGSFTKNIYVDGVLKKTGSGPAYAYNDSYKKLLIGRGYGQEYLGSYRFGFSGEMKFARMYPTTLTSDEVAYLYSQI